MLLENMHKLIHAKGEVLDDFRRRGDGNGEAHKKLDQMMESIIDILFEGRHIKEISPKMWRKYKNMKFIDTEYYPDLTQEEKDKIEKIKGQQEKYERVVSTGDSAGDKAMSNIGAGNLKRTQHQLQNLTREQKAKIYKSMGKAINRRIQRDRQNKESDK